MTTPAGWYPEQQGSNALRYWDGAQWTEQTRIADQSEIDPDTIWTAQSKKVTGIGGGRYRLTSKYLFFESGIVRTSAQQIPTNEIFDVDASQSMTQKARGVGSITMRVLRADQSTELVTLEDIAEFREGVSKLNEAAHAERERLTSVKNAQTITHSGSALGAPGAPHPEAATANSQGIGALRQLTDLYRSGILDADTFASKAADQIDKL